MRGRRWVGLLAAVAAAGVGLPAASAGAGAEPPKRVLVVMIDQLRPDFVERFDMANVRALMRGGANFDRALLGHMASTTVVTHNVITSGRLPKHMGWTNEVYRDTSGALGGGYHVTSSLGCGDFDTLLRAQGYPKLDDFLGGKFMAVGQKPTAVCPAAHPADPEDILVHIGSRNANCDGAATANWRRPGGFNIPAYLNAECGRFFVNSAADLDYGTLDTSPAWMYPLDGNRFAVGDDPAHRGGDVWAADAAIELLRHEADWKGMLVSFGSVDKAAHMWGSDDEGPSGVGEDVHAQAHLPSIAKTADQQVGRLLAALDALGLRDETLVVFTTDHAGQTALRYHGVDGLNRGNFNWYYGSDANETYLLPQPAIQPLLDTGNIDFTYQDGHVAAWLKDTSLPALKAGAQAMRRLPDVIAAYYRSGERYVLHGGLGAMSVRELLWWLAHGQRLVDTMAAADGNGPDVVGLLRDDTSYGVRGDHGGHQRAIQRIPIAFSWPGLKAQSRGEPIRAVDILPTVLRLMRLPGGEQTDGRAYRLALKR